MILIEGNTLTAMVAAKYFGDGMMLGSIAETEATEKRIASELAEAIAKKYDGTVERVWLDNKAGGWFTEIKLACPHEQFRCSGLGASGRGALSAAFSKGTGHSTDNRGRT